MHAHKNTHTNTHTQTHANTHTHTHIWCGKRINISESQSYVIYKEWEKCGIPVERLALRCVNPDSIETDCVSPAILTVLYAHKHTPAVLPVDREGLCVSQPITTFPSGNRVIRERLRSLDNNRRCSQTPRGEEPAPAGWTTDQTRTSYTEFIQRRSNQSLLKALYNISSH